MENNTLNKLWEMQPDAHPLLNPNAIIKEARKQRRGQFISIGVMMVTVAILLIYAFFHAFRDWNTFNLGLTLMIASLVFRIALERYSLHRKEQHLINESQKAFQDYLKNYYKKRRTLHYLITPMCVAAYIFGFYLLLPYFKGHFSEGFYTYILISGSCSLLVIVYIIVRSILQEKRYVDYFKSN